VLFSLDSPLRKGLVVVLISSESVFLKGLATTTDFFSFLTIDFLASVLRSNFSSL